MGTSLEIRERRVRDLTILELAGHLILDGGDAPFTDHVDGLVREGRLKLLVDLRNVTYIDSTGLGVLVSKYVSVQKRGGELKLLEPSSRVRRVLTIAGLLRTFDVFESEDEAVRSFRTTALPLHATVG